MPSIKETISGMKYANSIRTRSLQAALLATALVLSAGCNRQQQPQQQARTDQQIASDIQSKIAAENALSGQAIQVNVANGVATLSGTANDEASRALAANDAGNVNGVKTVINNLTVAPPPQQAAAPAPAPVPERKALAEHRKKQREEKQVAQAPAETQQPAPTPEPVQQTAPPSPPPPPPQPVAKTITIPAGTIVPVRITEGLNSQTARPNQVFHGSLAGDLIADGMVAISHGANVTGRVVDAKDAAHFSGSSLLSIELTQISAQGRQIPVVTDAYSRQGQGRGKNTAMKAGGGAALGAIIGALAGGGRGAAIGAAAGGATGAGVNAVTRGQQVQIQPETLINFKLQSPITVPTSQKAGSVRSFDDNTSTDPQLQPR
jgi:hypothetical protein